MAAQMAALSGGRSVNPGPPPPMSPELAAQYAKESHLADRPAGAYVPGDYNAVEVLLTENSVQSKFNGRTIPDSEKDGYGQIGFYVGGTGEVHIKDFMYEDILNHTWAPDETSKKFREIRVDPTTTPGAQPLLISITTGRDDIGHPVAVHVRNDEV